MSELGAVLYGHLTNDPTLMTTVGDSIWPGRLPQNPSLPAITYARLAAPVVATQTSFGLRRVHMAFSCWATTSDEAASVGAALIQSLGHQLIDAGGGKCLLLGDRDMGQDPETGLFRRLVEFQIHHEE